MWPNRNSLRGLEQGSRMPGHEYPNREPYRFASDLPSLLAPCEPLYTGPSAAPLPPFSYSFAAPQPLVSRPFHAAAVSSQPMKSALFHRSKMRRIRRRLKGG